MEETLIRINFDSFELFYIELPENYPEQPIRELGPQPAAYTQGDYTNLFVTMVMPLSAQHALQQPEYMEMKISGRPETYLFECTFRLTGDNTTHISARLAIVEFSVTLPEEVNRDGSIKIAVYVNDGAVPPDDNIGKVVMDANMIPTNP